MAMEQPTVTNNQKNLEMVEFLRRRVGVASFLNFVCHACIAQQGRNGGSISELAKSSGAGSPVCSPSWDDKVVIERFCSHRGVPTLHIRERSLRDNVAIAAAIHLCEPGGLAKESSQHRAGKASSDTRMIFLSSPPKWESRALTFEFRRMMNQRSLNASLPLRRLSIPPLLKKFDSSTRAGESRKR